MAQNNEEIWKDIPGYNGRYKASNFGRIRSENYRNTGRSQIMETRNHNGYRHIQLQRNGKYVECAVHRLIALTFIPTIESKNCVDHIDGDPSNNNVSNLRWCTQAENNGFPLARERKRQGTLNNPNRFRPLSKETRKKISESRKGRFFGKDNSFYGKKHSEETKKKLSEKRKISGIPIIQLTMDGIYIREWRSAKSASEALDIKSPSSITECCRNKRRSIGGYKWKYKSEYNKTK